MRIKQIIVLFFMIVSTILVSCKSRNDKDHASHTAKIYTCSMHPQIQKTEPGNCPICGMTLIEKKDGMAGDTSELVSDVVDPTYQKFLSNIITIKPTVNEFPLTIKANGIITYDTKRIYNISSRVSGRIEKLYVKYPFQPITKGQKLFEIYSPELLTAQQNLIFVLTNDSLEKNLIESSREKLRLLGMKNSEITEVEKTKNPKYQITVYSDYTGYAVSKDYKTKEISSGTSTAEMSGVKANDDKTQQLSLTEGMYVEQGETVLKIVNTDIVWALLKVYNSDYSFLKTNQKAEIYADNKENAAFTGAVNFIATLNENDNKMVNVRIYVSNSEKNFKIGQLVTSVIYAGEHKGIWVPKKSVLDLGRKKIVLVKSKNVFSARIVATGAVYSDWIEIVSGLGITDEIASNAQFFAGSESFINILNHEK